MPRDLIGTTAAAELCGVSKSTFQRMVTAGRIKAETVGDWYRAGWVFERADVEALAESLGSDGTDDDVGVPGVRASG